MHIAALAVVGTIAVAARAGAQNPALTVVSHEAFADGSGNTVVIGEVRNDTSVTLSIPRAIVTINGTEMSPAEVWTGSARRLSAAIFAFALTPNQTGFFRLSTTIPFSPSTPYSVRAEAQQLVTAQPSKTALDVTVSFKGSSYSLAVRNLGDSAIAHNVHAGVGGYVSGELNDVDFSSVGGTLCASSTMVMPGGTNTVTVSGAFERPVADMAAKGIALKWDEIYVEPTALLAPGAGGTGFITVNSQCAWTAQSNAPWITVLSGATGAGIGRVDVCAPPNPTTATRTGTLTIAGLTVRVDQAAGTGTGTTPTDTEIVAGVIVRAQHLADLRSRIQALRSRFKLAAYSWMDDPLSATVTQIRAVHITQLRQALADVYVAARLCPPTYTDSSLTAGMTIKAAHVAELRAAVNAIE